MTDETKREDPRVPPPSGAAEAYTQSMIKRRRADDGGPAFPQSSHLDSNGEIDWTVFRYSGMTLRDYFAMNASEADMASVLVGMDLVTGIPSLRDRVLARYLVADAMLEERTNKP